MKNTAPILICLALSGVAGATEIHDESGILPASTRNALSEKRYSFESKVFFGSWTSHDSLKLFLHSQTGNTGASVGIDPAHHMTEIWAGSDVNLNGGELSQASAKGNAFFRNGDYGGGVNAILESLATYTQPRNVVQVQGGVNRTEVQVDSAAMTWILGSLFVIGFLLLVWLAFTMSRRARRKAAEALENKYTTSAETGEDMSLFKDRPSLAYEMGRVKGQSDANGLATDAELDKAVKAKTNAQMADELDAEAHRSYQKGESSHEHVAELRRRAQVLGTIERPSQIAPVIVVQQPSSGIVDALIVDDILTS